MSGRLLFVTDVSPLPLDRGQSVRVFNLVRACAQTLDVTLVAPAPEAEDERRELRQLCQHTVWIGEAESSLREARRDRWAARRAAPGLKRRSTIASYLPLVSALRRANLDDFDLIWAERPHVARTCAAQRAHTVLDLDDIEHVRIRRAMGVGHTLHQWARPGVLYRYQLYKHLELRWSSGFAASVVCSELDRRYLEERGCSNVRVVPNVTAMDLSRAPRVRRCADGPAPGVRLAFVGNLAHEPNADAVAYFVSAILPVLRQKLPGVAFTVFGNCPDTLRARFGEQAEFKGFVPDLQAALDGCDVLVCPVRFGSGTRVKLVDAMACGIPIVTTAAGADGLPLLNGQHVLVAETPEEFSTCIVRLVSEFDLARTLCANARALVSERFTWLSLQRDLSSWLLQLLERVKRRP